MIFKNNLKATKSFWHMQLTSQNSQMHKINEIPKPKDSHKIIDDYTESGG